MSELLALAWPSIPGAPVEYLLFVGLALGAIAGALGVVLSSDPFHSALLLIVNFAALGVLYLLLDSPFVAIAQVIVYAGAVVVLFLFVIAYLGDRRELIGGVESHRTMLLAGGVLAAIVGVGLATVAFAAKMPRPGSVAHNDTLFAFGSPQAIGQTFLTKYLLEFEATSIVLLVAAIGGIALGLTGRARHRRMRAMMHTQSADQRKRETRRELKTPAAAGKERV